MTIHINQTRHNAIWFISFRELVIEKFVTLIWRNWND